MRDVLRVMLPARWHQIESLFASASPLTGEDRRRFLDEACKDDDELRRELESLLENGDLPAPFLDTTPNRILNSGDRVGPYTIIDLLGAGGMGEIYKAHDARLRRDIAIKFLPRIFAEDPASLERFHLESRAASALNHPRICTIHDAGEFEGRPYFVMELLEGRSLRDCIGAKLLSMAELLDVACQICDALQAAHSKAIVHRDIKPANIVVTTCGQVKILDFGIAKLAREPDATAMSQPGRLMGTIAYMSPEQARGEEVDARTDLFSFGLVLYEMATGFSPFSGKTTVERINSILHHAPVPPSSLNPSVSRSLDRIILKALSKSRSERYQSAEHMLADLERFRRKYSSTRLTRRKVLAASVAGLATAAGGAFLARLTIFPPKRKVLVAVLPLDDQGSDPQFATGLHEAMISNLGRLYREHFIVIAKPSVGRYKGANIKEIGRDLGIDYVVEGSIRRKGHQVRVNARLVRVRDEAPLWSGSFERDLDQLLSVQVDLAEVIGHEIESTLRPDSQVRRTLSRKVNPDAYEAYLRGDYRKSIELDPRFAPAHAGLAQSLLVPALFGLVEPRPAFAEIIVTASKALELDNTLAQAHASLALAKLQLDFKWKDAEDGYRRALQLTPDDPWMRHFFAHYLLWHNQPRESAEECARALEHDPFDTDLILCTAWHDLWAGNYEKAVGGIRRALSFDPDNRGALLITSWAYEQQGKFQDAISALKKLRESTAKKAAIAGALARGGRGAAAREILEELLQQSQKTYTSAYDIAVIYAGLGQIGTALQWLDKAYAERSGFLLYVTSDPRLKALRTEPQFQDVIRRMGLLQAA